MWVRRSAVARPNGGRGHPPPRPSLRPCGHCLFGDRYRSLAASWESGGRADWGSGGALLALTRFELGDGAWPVGLEEAGKGAVGEKAATGLAVGAVVGLVLGVDDALDGGAAARAGEAEAAVDRHLGAERRDLLGEGRSVAAQALEPFDEGVANGVEEALGLLVVEVQGALEGRQAGAVQDLVGVGVADAGEDRRVGERPLQSMALVAKGGAEARQVGVQHLQAAGVQGGERRLALDQLQRRPFLAAGLGEQQGTAAEVEGRETVAPRDRRSRRPPAQAGRYPPEAHPR